MRLSLTVFLWLILCSTTSHAQQLVNVGKTFRCKITDTVTGQEGITDWITFTTFRSDPGCSGPIEQ